MNSQTADFGPEGSLRLAIAPDLGELSGVRAHMQEVGRLAGLSDSRIFDLQVTVSEAAANAIEHAASEVEIATWVLPDRLIAEITNDGVFQPGLVKSGDARRRGLGLPLMVSLAAQVHVSRLSVGRTKVTLTFFVSADVAAQDNVGSLTGPRETAIERGEIAQPQFRTPPAMWFLLAPIPLLMAAVAVLYALQLDGERESAVLLTAFNTLFVSAGSLIVAYLAARTYLAGGSRAMLLLGAGALLLGLAHIIAGPLVTDPNDALSTHNSLFFVSGVLFAGTGLLILRRSGPLERPPARSYVVAGYGAAVALVVLLYVLVSSDACPAFWVAGVGPTLARDLVVGLGVVAFLLAAVCFTRVYRMRPSTFALLAGASFSMFAVSLGSLALTRAATGSPINWTTRGGTWIAGMYLLAGVLGMGYARGWLLPLERSLRESEDRYRNLVDLTPDAVLVQSAGRYLFANRAAADMLGYSSPKDIVGKDVDEVLAPATRQAALEMIGEAYAGAVPPASDEMFFRADGSVVEANVARARVEFGGRVAIQAVARDITERKKAEEDLRESERGFRNLLMASSELLYRMNSDWSEMGQLRSGGFLVNAEGPNPNWLQEYIPAGERNRVVSAVNEAIRTKTAFELEHQVFRADGTVGWTSSRAIPIVDESGEIIEWFGAAGDITERKKAEDALRESEERYRSLAAENERLYRQQLDIAENLQNALLHIPSTIGRVGVGHLYRSATEAARVGGDFYDVFEVRAGRIAVLLGDVSGHGIEAARLATLTKDVIHAFTHQSLLPHRVLHNTNRLLLEKSFEGFVTVFLGIVEPEAGTLVYSSAGHPEALLRRASGSVELLGGPSSPLGVYPEAVWKPHEAELEAGDLLLLYTDGAIEARREGEFFGVERLERLLKHKNISVGPLPREILKQVLAFAGGTLQDDLASQSRRQGGQGPGRVVQ